MTKLLIPFCKDPNQKYHHNIKRIKNIIYHNYIKIKLNILTLGIGHEWHRWELTVLHYH